MLEEGWYLMSTSALESLLRKWRAGVDEPLPDEVERLTTQQALAIRNAGNVPDDRDRSLRLVLEASTQEELRMLHAKRLLFEPDYHAASSWRREGSRPVNVVPLRAPGVEGTAQPWWEDERAGALEDEWLRTGAVGDLKIPEAIRGFVFKTIISLRDTDREVRPDTVADSIARWLAPEQAEAIRRSLRDANPDADG